MSRLNRDAEKFPVRVDGLVRPLRSWTDDELREAVRGNTTLAGVQRALGFSPSGGMHRSLRRHIRLLGLDTTHFTGRGWARGRPGANGFRPRPLAEILVAGSDYLDRARLRRRLVAAGLKQARCERCGLDEWQGEPLPLALDHINGDASDNRLENLRILCPNCHALTDTWCGRNNRRRTPTAERPGLGPG